METKICVNCLCELERTKEFFVVDKRNPDGLGARCRICERLRLKEHYKKNPDKKKEYWNSHSEHIKLQRHQHYLENTEQHKKRTKVYYENNKERARELSKQWKKDNPNKLIASSHRHYEKVKEHHKIITKRWKQEHKEERNISWQARRSKKLSLECSLTSDQWNLAKLHFGNSCCYCGRELKLTQDHFVPLSNGGEYSFKNIVPSCQTCNSSKSIKGFSEWYPFYKYYSAEREQKITRYIELAQVASQV